MKKKPNYVITARSESGDKYGPKLYDHIPTRKELKKFVEETGEELNCGGPGDFGSYVYVEVDEV